MRVGCQSDHHLDDGYDEFGDKYLESLVIPEADVLLIPGDLAANHEIVGKALARFARHVEHVIYVPGNHEHDGKDINDSRRSLVEVCNIPGVHLLDDGFVDINGVRFIGSTLWSDCGNPQKQEKLQRCIFKYWPIMNGDRDFSPQDATILHQNMLGYIAYQLGEARRNDLLPVVVTHHAPSKNSVHTRFLMSDLNEAFYSDLEDFIELNEPLYWFHGHMHHSCNYKISNTRIICNPLGSYSYGNGLYDPKFIVKI